MQEYDYRISDEAVNKASNTIDKLSKQDLVKLSWTADELRQKQEKVRFTKAKEYFQAAVLPGLKDFAEMSGSVLYIEEYDERMSVQAIFKNELGFDITENCRLMRSLLFMTNSIGIMTEGDQTTLSLVYKYTELMDM